MAEMSGSENEGPTSTRLRGFTAEVESMRLDGGRVGAERVLLALGAVGMVGGIVLAIVMWSATHGTQNPLEQADYRAAGTCAVVIAIVGTGLFVVMSLRRYLRYWLLRLIYEMRVSSWTDG